jgi:hypothetical protein
MISKLKGIISAYWILIALITLKFILQFALLNPVYELQRDEFLHLNQADHLAWGFISVPPFTALIAVIINLLGGGLFWIRFFPALYGALTIIVTWLIVEAIGGTLISRVLAASALVFSVLLRLNMLYQPNSFDILVWTIIFFLLIRWVQSANSKWLYFLALTIALGFYNKYNVLFLIGGLTIAVIFTEQVKLLFKSSFWLALLLAVALLLPNIIWQIVWHFPVLHHMQALKVKQLDNNSYFVFLNSVGMMFFGSLPLTIGALVAFFFYRPFRNYSFIGLSVILTTTIFTLLKAKGYYAIGLFPVLFAFGSVYIENILRGKWKLIVVCLLGCINLVMFISVARLIMPVLTPAEIRAQAPAFERLGLLRWEDGQNHSLPQDFADMLGWKEMAGKALAIWQSIPAADMKNTIIFCDNYGQTGALNYYNRKKMPEAYSFNTDYIYWMPRLSGIRNILLVGKDPGKNIKDMFKTFIQVGAVENEYSREKSTGIFLLMGANEDVSELLNKKAEERKLKFDIF